MQREPQPYYRRASHRRHVGIPLEIDSRNRNQWKPVYQPKWITLGCVVGFWFLGWVVVRAAIQ